MDPTLQTVLTIFTPLLTIIVAGISYVVGQAMSRWQAREQVKTMQANSKLAVQAVEQLAAGQPNEVKAKMALQIAQQLNQQAKIAIPDTTVAPMNEAHVLTLPPTTDNEPKG